MATPIDQEYIQDQTIKKILKTVEAYTKLVENRDERAYALLQDLYPPKNLILGRAQLYIRYLLSKSEKRREVLKAMIDTLDRLLDLFQKSPVFISTMMKEEATSEDEVEVITE